MSKHKEKLLIVDGNALIHRSFHALPPTMQTKAGEMVNAVYGFASVLLKAIKEFKPEYVVLTLDKKGPTFRHEQYAEYKAHREKAPDDLYKQIPFVKKVAQALNIPIFELTGFEADDLIGTISRTVDGGVDKIIVTGDMDAMQLVNEHTRVYTMSRGFSDSVIYDTAKVRERYSLEPSQMIDYKALRGDPSDNIPGVKGIGEKTATDILHEFSTLDNLYKLITCNSQLVTEKIKPRIVELLKQYKDDAFMSRDLATIKCDVRIDFNLEKTRFGDFNKDEVVKLFSELEFKSLMPRIQELGRESQNVNRKSDETIDKFVRNKESFKYVLVDDEKGFDKFYKELLKQKEFTFDTETTSFDILTAELLGISFSWKEGEAYFLKLQILNFKLQIKEERVDLFNYQANKNTDLNKYNDLRSTLYDSRKMHPWILKLKGVFEDSKIKKHGHNMKFDVSVMKNNGVEVVGSDFDTMIASYLLNPGSRQHNLDTVTFTELGWEKISKDDLLGKGKEKTTFAEVETEKLALYSCEDADFTNRLVEALKKQLQENNLYKLFQEIEMPLVAVLVEMENNGISLDKNFLAELEKQVDKRIKKLEKDIYKEAGFEFNINSTKQLKEVLFDELNISTDGIKKGKTGFSTGADELEKLKDSHEIIKYIQEYRELTKLFSTYIKALPELINVKTKRVHTSYNQTVTATGRLSSSEPNLQNIPVKTELGREIRKAFVADKGNKLIALDYSQIELRVVAHMSLDQKMIKAFTSGLDIHTSTAAEINEVGLDEVTPEMRREAKAVNFGILYGQGAHGLSQNADIPYHRAKEFIEDYFIKFPGVKKFIDKTIEEAKTQGYVETLFGRRRYLPEINSSVIMVKKGAERMAVNTPIQGTAADMIKIAMIESFKHLCSVPDAKIKILLQVHDELVFEVKTEEAEKYALELKEIMENVIKLTVPIVVDVKMGENWGEMEKIKL